MKTGNLAFISDSEDPAICLRSIRSHGPCTLPTVFAMIGHRRAIPGATGVHLRFQGHEGMEATGWRKSSAGSGREQDRASVALVGRTGLRVCILGHKKGEIGQHPPEARCSLRISLLAETGNKGLEEEGRG